MKDKIETKWGTVKINSQGYYQITSSKEGNHGKLLHRLIWEDFYKCEIPDGFIIHHKNENPIDNCILNLQLMRLSDHISMHNSHNNTTGYYRVSKQKTTRCKQGFVWIYQYWEDDEQKRFGSVNLIELKEKVKAAGKVWRVYDVQNAKATCDEYGYNYEDLI